MKTEIRISITVLCSIIAFSCYCQPYHNQWPSLFASSRSDTTRNVHIVNVPDCILNDSKLTIKTNVISYAVLPGDVLSEFDNQTFYMPASPDQRGLYPLGQIRIPDEGSYELLFRSMLVIRDDEGCDKPFLPLLEDYPPGFDFWSFSIYGCCFGTPCCPCDEYLKDEWAQHRIKDRRQRYSHPIQPGTSGQNIGRSLSCWCCVD